MKTLLVLLALVTMMVTPVLGGCFSPDETTMVYVYYNLTKAPWHGLHDFVVNAGDDMCYSWRNVLYTMPAWSENVTLLANGSEEQFLDRLKILPENDWRDGQ
jgi:hypothetical protein